jgi:hypothetical protein
MPPAEAPSLPRTGTPHERQPGARRTVVIRGQVAPPPGVARTHAGDAARTHAGRARSGSRRPPRRTRERIVGTRPDRAALWAVLMGVFLIVVAVMTAA